MRCLRDHPSAPCSFVTSCVGGRFECSRLRIATPWQAAPPRRIFFASLIAEEAPRRVPPPAAWSRVLLGPAVTVRPVCGVVPHAPHRHGSSRKRVPPCRRAHPPGLRGSLADKPPRPLRPPPPRIGAQGARFGWAGSEVGVAGSRGPSAGPRLQNGSFDARPLPFWTRVPVADGKRRVSVLRSQKSD